MAHSKNCACMQRYSDMAKSDNKDEAAAGRFLQKFHPMLHEYVREETKRDDSSPRCTVQGAAKGFAMEMAEFVLQAAHDGRQREAMRNVGLGVMLDLMTLADSEEVIEAIAKDAKPGHPMDSSKPSGTLLM